MFYNGGLSLAKPNNKGTLELHLSPRICFSALSEDRHVTVSREPIDFSLGCLLLMSISNIMPVISSICLSGESATLSN